MCRHSGTIPVIRDNFKTLAKLKEGDKLGFPDNGRIKIHARGFFSRGVRRTFTGGSAGDEALWQLDETGGIRWGQYGLRRFQQAVA